MTEEKRILVAEDSPTQAERVRLLLEEAGYRVDVAPDGRGALERVRLEPPDLIVSDVTMPEMDGYELCRAIRDSVATRRIPFVLLTDRRGVSDIIRGLEAGADNFITKPFEDAKLLERVERIFENLALRRRSQLDFDVMVRTGTRQISLSADKQQIFELLFSTLEDLDRAHGRLLASERELEERNRELEDRVRERTEALRSLFDGVPVGLYRTSPAGQILDANPALAEMLGYPSREALTGADVARHYANLEDRARWRREIAEGGIVRGFELQVRRLDGSPIWGRLHARATRDAAGQIVHYEGALEDVTERRRAEEALRTLNAELEGRVAERTAELAEANARLAAEVAERRRAEEEAAAANRAKTDFLSRMSHELRTPLNAVLGFAQLLDLSQLSPEDRESVTHISKAGRHLLDLINEVLDIARIEAGRMALSPEPVPVREVTEAAVALIQPLAEARRVQMALAAGRAWGRWVIADRQRLQQVLLNLLSNAVKYNRDGGRVTLSCAAAPAGRLRVSVADTGPGMSAEMLARLFRPFERLGAETQDVEGTGLGLALSKRLVEAMGGTIGVESAPGEGSTFWVQFPQTEPPEAAGARAAGPTEDHASGTRRGTVLYIEDNLSNLKLIERVVERRPGVRLISAMQGRIGLDLAREHHADLVLLDLHLPDIEGRMVLARLRAHPETSAIPVVVLSADATPAQIRRLKEEGARDYLTKPVDIGRLLALLDELLPAAEE